MTQPPQPPYSQQPPQGGQYPPQYGAPQTQTPKRRKKWPWILGAIVAFFVIIAVATSGGGDESTSTGSSPTGSNSTGENSENSGGSSLDAGAAPAGIGNEVRDGKFAFTVTDVETGITQAGDNPYANKVPQGQFVFVHVDVKNTGDKAQSYFGSNQKLIDVQGREFNNDTEAEIYANDNFTIGDINPGNTASVIVVFDIPPDAQPKTVELHDSMFSGGATVNIG